MPASLKVGSSGQRLRIERLGEPQPLHRRNSVVSEKGSVVTLRVSDPTSYEPFDGRVGEPLVDLYWCEASLGPDRDSHKVFGAKLHQGEAFSDEGLAAFITELAKRAKRSGAETVYLELDDDVRLARRVEKVDISATGFPPLVGVMTLGRTVEVASHLELPVVGPRLQGDAALTPAELADQLAQYRQQSRELRTQLAEASEVLDRVRLSDAVVAKAAEDGVVLPTLEAALVADEILESSWKPIPATSRGTEKLLATTAESSRPVVDESGIADVRWAWCHSLKYVNTASGFGETAIEFLVVRSEADGEGRSIDVVVEGVGDIAQVTAGAFVKQVREVAKAAGATTLSVQTDSVLIADWLRDSGDFTAESDEFFTSRLF
jgi:hypothetical protein